MCIRNEDHTCTWPGHPYFLVQRRGKTPGYGQMDTEAVPEFRDSRLLRNTRLRLTRTPPNPKGGNRGFDQHDLNGDGFIDCNEFKLKHRAMHPVRPLPPCRYSGSRGQILTAPSTPAHPTVIHMQKLLALNMYHEECLRPEEDGSIEMTYTQTLPACGRPDGFVWPANGARAQKKPGLLSPSTLCHSGPLPLQHVSKSTIGHVKRPRSPQMVALESKGVSGRTVFNSEFVQNTTTNPLKSRHHPDWFISN